MTSPTPPSPDAYPDPKSASSITTNSSGTMESGGPRTPLDDVDMIDPVEVMMNGRRERVEERDQLDEGEGEEDEPSSESKRGKTVSLSGGRNIAALEMYKPSKLQAIPPFVRKPTTPTTTTTQPPPPTLGRGTFPSVLEMPTGGSSTSGGSNRPSTASGGQTRGLGIELEKDLGEGSPLDGAEEGTGSGSGRKRRLGEEHDDPISIKRESSPSSSTHPPLPGTSTRHHLSPSGTSVSPRPHSSHASLPTPTHPHPSQLQQQKRQRLSPSTQEISSSHGTAAAAASLLSIRNPPTNPPISPIVLGFSPNNKTEFEQVEKTLGMKQQQQREIERRNGGGAGGEGSPNSGGGGSRLGGGLNGALRKLDERERERERERIAMAQGMGQGEDAGSPSSTSTSNSGGGGTLAKRRKTKNLTVLTPGYGTSHSAGALKSAPAKTQSQSHQSTSSSSQQPHLNSARLLNGNAIPSVLIGSKNLPPSTGMTGSNGNGNGSRTPTVLHHRIPNGPATSVPTTTSSSNHRTVSGPSISGRKDKEREGPQTARVVSSNYPSVVQQPSTTTSSTKGRSNGGGGGGSGSTSAYPQSASAYSTVHPQAREIQESSTRRGAQYPHGHPLYRPPHPTSTGAGVYSPPTIPVSPPSASSLPLGSATTSISTTSGSSNNSNSNSKAAFLSLFSTFYDSLSDSRVLTQNLEDQIKKSSYLLKTLQDSSKMFEEMLEKRVEGVERVLSRDLVLNERRIERLERLLLGVEAEEVLGEWERDGRGRKSVEERLDGIERMLEKRAVATAAGDRDNVAE